MLYILYFLFIYIFISHIYIQRNLVESNRNKIVYAIFRFFDLALNRLSFGESNQSKKWSIQSDFGWLNKIHKIFLGIHIYICMYIWVYIYIIKICICIMHMNECTIKLKKIHWLSERLASLVIMGAQLRVPLSPSIR